MSRRSELVAAIGERLRLQSSLGVVLHQAVADRFGLNPADLKCLDIAQREPDVTAGRIAELTAMSTSAVTAMLDRLEKRGFVERRRDATDRRRVFVHSTGRHERELAEVFGPLAAATGKAMDGYTVDELAVIEGFLGRLADSSRTFLEKFPKP
jgi:DNA-binding MarR family transcriptional regulator